MPVPPVQVAKPEACQLKEQPVKDETDCEVAGSDPAPAHRLLSTVLPSDCRQVTLRVSVAVVEQVDDGADHEPADQL